MYYQAMLRDHCYFSLDYSEDIKKAADPHNLVQLDRVIQFPFTPLEDGHRPEDEVLRMQEKKREQGRRLQAQAFQVRTERLLQKEQDLATFLTIKEMKSQEKKADYLVGSTFASLVRIG